MPKPTFVSVPEAREKIDGMLDNFATSGSFGTSAMGNAHARVVHASRSEDGRTSTVTVRMQIQEQHGNNVGTLHGGCAATLVDNITSLPLYFHSSGEVGEPWCFLGVTTSLNLTYLSGSPVGSWIDIVARVESVGRSLAVIEGEIFDVPDGEHGTTHGAKRVHGVHTKFDNSGMLRKSKL